MLLDPGTRLGPYEIIGSIGAGGMGEVYRARDTRLDRVVAIKILPEGLAGDPAARERFEREARTISQINHSHICTLHDVGHQVLSTGSGQAVDYLVLEYLEGETLASRLSRGPLPVDQALAIAIDICDALDTAHRSNITHRDLKPANVMLMKSGTNRQGPPQAKLLDFGLAKTRVAVLATRPSEDSGGPTRLGGPITTEGSILGTIQYMAPEQIEGREADARSDIWAFGCVLYEMLSGAAPFGGQTHASLIAAILEREPRPISPALPPFAPRLGEVVRVCLEKEPTDRWQSARDLLRELRWIARDASSSAAGALSEPVRSAGVAGRRPWLLAAAALLVAGAGAVVWLRPAPQSVAAARTGPPVIVLMDSPHPERVYDPETRKAGGTNADDLSDLLRDLPVVLLKENTNATWHRESQVLQENPALIVAHRSCFYDTTMFDPAKFGDVGHTELFAALAHDKFDTFMGYVGQGNSETRFVVDPRGSWADETARAQWVTTMEQRFPTLRGRVDAMKVPMDRATFRHPTTGAEIKTRIENMLKIDAALPVRK